MIKIILENMEFIRMQIEDFLDKIAEAVLDLRESLNPYRGYSGRSPAFFRRVERLKSHAIDRAQWRLDNFSCRYFILF